jgi:predicted glycogen debranching enzyme
MDARVNGLPITGRAGKPVEVNALWVNACSVVANLADRTGGDPSTAQRLAAAAIGGFRRFARRGGVGLLDVVDDADGHGGQLRPNQLFAVSLPNGPLAGHRDVARAVLDACAPLVTPLGLRTLDPADPAYLPLHRGDPAARDRAYHNGTVWPFLIGAYVDVALIAGRDAAPLLAGLEAHISEFGLVSVSETADGAAPHNGSGCPFQAWSVAELLRARRRLNR